MIITNNLKNKLQLAKNRKYKKVWVSRTKNFNKYAFLLFDIDQLLKMEIGSKTGSGYGTWETKDNQIPNNAIQYQDLFKL